MAAMKCYEARTLHATSRVRVAQKTGFFGFGHGPDTGKHGLGLCPLLVLKNRF